MFYLCFFFQAEDGIRDGTVTGVQTFSSDLSYYDYGREKQGKDNPNGHWFLRCRCDQILYQYDVDIGATSHNRKGRSVGDYRQENSEDMPRLQTHVPRLV